MSSQTDEFIRATGNSFYKQFFQVMRLKYTNLINRTTALTLELKI